MKLPALINLCLTGLLVNGCSENKQPAPATTAASGKVIIKGSNTIGEELAPRLITEFKKDHPSAAFDLEAKATVGGGKSFENVEARRDELLLELGRGMARHS